MKVTTLVAHMPPFALLNDATGYLAPSTGRSLAILYGRSLVKVTLATASMARTITAVNPDTKFRAGKFPLKFD